MALRTIIVIIIAIITASAMEIESGSLRLAVAPDAPFSYSIAISNVTWFSSFDFVFSGRSAARGEILGAIVTSTTSLIAIDWTLKDDPLMTVVWKTSFLPGLNQSALVFRQTFVNTTGGTNGTAFPLLCAAPTAPCSLGTLEYSGMSCGFMSTPHPKFTVNGGPRNGFFVIVPDFNHTKTTLVLGPASEFFANQASPAANECISYGLAASFPAVPEGYSFDTVLVASTAGVPTSGVGTDFRRSMPAGGVNAALSEFGDFLLQRYGKQRSLPDVNTQVEFLGYSTTGFFFYNLCDCLDPVDNIYQRTRCANASVPHCQTYADTLRAVDAALRTQDIAYHHLLLDSWWYGENIHDGVWKWEDAPDVVNVSFPESLRDFWLGLNGNISIWAHNGAWTAQSPYITDGNYSFSATMPQGRALWDYLFSSNKKWGLNVLKQDHMLQQMLETPESWTNVTVLNSWLSGMGEGAIDNGAGIMYCCAPPSVHMNGVTVPAAFGVRASPDYVWQSSGKILKLPQIQWAIGPDSAFHMNALGLLPYKDTFFSNASASPKAGTWTSNTSQWVPFTGFFETNAATHALMATMSMAQVTFSDGVGSANKTLLDFIVNAQGKILKPDRPATAVDNQFRAMVFGDVGANTAKNSCEQNTTYGSDTVPPATPESEFESRGVSRSYASAYSRSARLNARLGTRRQGQCVSAPQGPFGEVYTTHAVVGGFMWVYVMAVQLSRPYLVTPTSDVGNVGNVGDAGATTTYVAVPFTLASGFRPTQRLALWSDDHPLQLTPIASSSPSDYPFEMHALAPVLPGGWVISGEVGKFVPVSNQRIRSLIVSPEPSFSLTVEFVGAPLETVIFGVARNVSSLVEFYECALGSSGFGSLACNASSGICQCLS